MKNIKITLLLILLVQQVGIAQTNDLVTIKKRVIEELFLIKPDDKAIEIILSKQSEDGSFTGINYTDLSRTASFPHGQHTNNLASMGKAFNTKSSVYYQSERIKSSVIKGLEFWVKNDFVGDNWHDNQITTPTNLVNLMLAMGNDLPKVLVNKAQPMINRANMGASGARPSGDRIVIAGLVAKNCLFLGKDAAFDDIIKIIADEMKFSTGQRGIQHDYSFHHRPDRVNNTDSYGYGKFANAYGEWSQYVAGTVYKFPIEKINMLIDYYLDGIYKQQVYGVYDDVSVKNRSIAGKNLFKPKDTREIERLFVSTSYRKKELEEIIKLRKGEGSPTQSFAKFFWQTEHFVFQRPEFYTSVRMFSTRNRNMEEPYNGPGKTTHHRADGTNYLVMKGDEYHNIWASYDWQKISGTTTMQKPTLPDATQIQKDGLTNFVGAVTDGLYGAVAFDFKSPHDMLETKKSWFFFDKEYVCLGAGIKPKSNLPVATTVNQVLLKSDVKIKQNGEIKILPNGNRLAENVKWVHQDNVGYLFPTSTEIHVSNQTETGRWSDLTDQKNISKELVSTDIFKLWFNHGDKINETDIHGSRIMKNRPTYEYIVVPNVSVENLEETSQNNRGIEILANTEDLQVVKHHILGQVQLAFYKAGEIVIDKGEKVKMESQGLALIKIKNGKIAELTLADPSRNLNKIMITLPGIYTSKREGVLSLPNAKCKHTIFIVDLPQGVFAGKSVHIKL